MSIFSKALGSSGTKIGAVLGGPLGAAVGAAHSAITTSAQNKKVNNRSPYVPAIASDKGFRTDPLAQSSSSSGISGYVPLSPLAKAFQVNPGADIHANDQALSALRNEALTPSSQSPWLKNQLQQISANRAQGLNEANRASAGQTAQARSNLALRGGLSGGAAERLGMMGAQQGLLAQQGVNNTYANQGLAAAQSAEENRMNTLRALPGMEIAATQPEFANRQFNVSGQQYNIGNVLQQNAMQNQMMQQQMQREAEIAAANRNADAYAQANKPGTNMFRNLADPAGVMKNNPTYNYFSDPFNFGGQGGSGGAGFKGVGIG